MNRLNDLLKQALDKTIDLAIFVDLFEDTVIELENEDIEVESLYYDILYRIAFYDPEHSDDKYLYTDDEFYKILKDYAKQLGVN